MLVIQALQTVPSLRQSKQALKFSLQAQLRSDWHLQREGPIRQQTLLLWPTQWHMSLIGGEPELPVFGLGDGLAENERPKSWKGRTASPEFLTWLQSLGWWQMAFPQASTTIMRTRLM